MKRKITKPQVTKNIWYLDCWKKEEDLNWKLKYVKGDYTGRKFDKRPKYSFWHRRKMETSYKGHTKVLLTWTTGWLSNFLFTLNIRAFVKTVAWEQQGFITCEWVNTFCKLLCHFITQKMPPFRSHIVRPCDMNLSCYMDSLACISADQPLNILSVNVTARPGIWYISSVASHVHLTLWS